LSRSTSAGIITAGIIVFKVCIRIVTFQFFTWTLLISVLIVVIIVVIVVICSSWINLIVILGSNSLARTNRITYVVRVLSCMSGGFDFARHVLNVYTPCYQVLLVSNILNFKKSLLNISILYSLLLGFFAHHQRWLIFLSLFWVGGFLAKPL
jgi:hypothetical protein